MSLLLNGASLIGFCLAILAFLIPAHAVEGPRLPWPDQNADMGFPTPAAPIAPAIPFQQAMPMPYRQPGNQIQDTLPQQLQQLLNSGGFGNNYNRGADSWARNERDMPSGSIGTVGSGTLDSCGEIPKQVKDALEEAKEYRVSCSKLADRGDKQKLVINDYSYQSRPPHMWVFDAEGNCIGKTAVTYGYGRLGKDGKPIPCSEAHHSGQNDGYMTPPGFHLTAKHNCADCSYNATNSLLMVGTEGQGSSDRGILIHGAESPGTATSQGCAGVGCLPDIMRTLGYGSLVYNFFGDTPTASDCRTDAGATKPHRCGPIDSAHVPEQATGEKSSSEISR